MFGSSLFIFAFPQGLNPEAAHDTAGLLEQALLPIFPYSLTPLLPSS